jgi:hypothetical protein
LKHLSPILLIISLTPLLALGCAPPAPKPVVRTVSSPTGDNITYPEIVPDPAKRSHTAVPHKFKFEGESHKVTVRVDEAVVAGARAANKNVLMQGDADDLDWNAGYQVAMMEEAEQDAFFSAVLEELDAIRKREGLDDDRYAELLTIFVQSIAYCTEDAQDPKFPIETFADRCGDCDDKSRLLAALLSREGYDAALFIFHPEKHMAVGLRSDGVSFKGTGYSYIETTSPAYIGFPSYEYSEVKLESLPEVLRVGKGETTYKRSDDVAYLHKTLEKHRVKAEKLKEELDEVKPEGERLKADYDRLSQEIENKKGSLSASEYNKLAAKANRAAKKFNQSVKAHNDLVRRLNESGKIIKHIIDNPDDRRGVVAWVRAK